MAESTLRQLQSTQNSALRIITGCTTETNTEHLHIETKTLPLSNHLKLHASQLRQKSQLPTHPLHNLVPQPTGLREMKETIFDNWSGKTITIKNDNNNTPTTELITQNPNTPSRSMSANNPTNLTLLLRNLHRTSIHQNNRSHVERDVSWPSFEQGQDTSRSTWERLF